ALHHGHQHAVIAAADLAGLDAAVVVEHGGEDAGARGHAHELGAEADEAASGHDEGHADATLAVRAHVLHVGLADAQLLDDGALVLFVDVDHDGFEGLHLHAVDFLDYHLRPRDGELKAFAAHGFDQHREVQFAAAADAELVRRVALFH